MRLIPLVLAAILSSGCAYPMMGGGPFRPPAHWAVGPPVALPSPSGRWDNVMMLEHGTPVRMLRMDGTRVDGRFLSASPAILRVETKGTALEIPQPDVARLDRLPHVGSPARAEAARGAMVGAGAVGLVGLLTGRLPHARHWAAGAIAGGYGAAQAQVHAAGPGTIYLAPMPAVADTKGP